MRFHPILSLSPSIKHTLSLSLFLFLFLFFLFLSLSLSLFKVYLQQKLACFAQKMACFNICLQNQNTDIIGWEYYLLYISTSVWMLRTPNACIVCINSANFYKENNHVLNA